MTKCGQKVARMFFLSFFLSSSSSLLFFFFFFFWGGGGVIQVYQCLQRSLILAILSEFLSEVKQLNKTYDRRGLIG